MADNLDRIKVIAFDVFGTVVDWHGSVKHEIEKLHPEIIGADFARAWRAGYQPAMAEVMDSGEWVILDVLHRRILDRVLPKFGLETMPEQDRHNLNLVWHRLTPWPDSVEGLNRLKTRYQVCSLSNGNATLLEEMAQNAGLPWNRILGAETFEKYKPHPDTYLGVAREFDINPDEVMLAAAHHSDLEHARRCGLHTAYIERHFEYGEDQPKPAATWERNDFHATSIINLAEQLGC